LTSVPLQPRPFLFSSKLYFISFQVQDGSTALILAASIGNIEQLSKLLEEGAHPDQRDAEGCSALHWAADRGQCDVITQLLQAGADINAVDGDGLTPLHYAALAEQKEAAIALVEGGSDLSIENQDGDTAATVAPSDWNISVLH
jgi:ankyrin repeat protein